MAQSKKSKTWSQPIVLDFTGTARIDPIDSCLCVRQALCHIYGLSVDDDNDDEFDFMEFLDDDMSTVPTPTANDMFRWWLSSCDVDQALQETKRVDIEYALRLIWPKEMTTKQMELFSLFTARRTLEDMDDFSLNITQSDALKRWMNETFLVKVKPLFDAAFSKFQEQEKSRATTINQRRSADAKDAITKLQRLGFQFGSITWPEGMEDPTPKIEGKVVVRKPAAKPPVKTTPRDGGGPNGEREPFPTMRK